MFVRNDLVEQKYKSCRKSSKRFLEFKKKLGFDPDVVTCDEQDIISALQVAFEGEIILTQYCIENKRLDAYFSEYKLGIEIDEYNHESRNSNYEKTNYDQITKNEKQTIKNKTYKNPKTTWNNVLFWVQRLCSKF